MAIKQQIRRRVRRGRAAVRRTPAATASAVRQDVKQRLSTEGGLLIGGVKAPEEKEADRLAGQVMRMPDKEAPIHRQCDNCSAKDDKKPLQRTSEEKEEENKIQAKPDSSASPVANGHNSVPASPQANKAINSLGSGTPLSRKERAFFEPRLGVNLSAVRIHHDAKSERAARAIHARAFTHGQDIAFAQGERQPETYEGKRLLAHELAHVAGEGSGAAQRQVRRDLAVESPNPEAIPENLSEERYAAAQSYNERRFEDPFTISIVRDVLGIEKYPAVIDQAFTDATLQWQANFGLREDGKFGPASTRRLVRVLQAEGNQRLAALVRSDNYVRVHDVLAPTFFGCGGAPGHPGRAFEWNVRFSTSLRGGFIVQRIDNVWNQNPAAAPHQRVPLQRYWEAWSVDNAGRVTPARGNVNDIWRRPMRAGTRGNWRMSGRLYTVLHLPATFGVGNAADAGPVLQSALAVNNSDTLGLPEGFTSIQHGDEGARTIGGRWDCTDPVVANRFHRRE